MRLGCNILELTSTKITIFEFNNFPEFFEMEFKLGSVDDECPDNLQCGTSTIVSSSS